MLYSGPNGLTQRPHLDVELSYKNLDAQKVSILALFAVFN